MSTHTGESSEPASVEEARRAVEERRRRMSGTLDELEDRIVEGKEELQRKVDVPGRLRDRVLARPWGTLGVAFGVGLAVGFLTGGSGGSGGSVEYDEDDDVHYVDHRFGFWRTVRAQLVGAAIAALTEAVHDRVAGPHTARERPEPGQD
ncbi:MAG: hypothetical protein WEB88_07410 [Gemmatimonadota bacterium]